MIFTLYSYKGGVGRSMALANVAHWLYLRGLTVLMVDWDLEAPGLETFFYQSAEKIELVRSHLGVIDLLTAYCRQFPYLSGPSLREGLPPIETYLCNIEPEVEYAPTMRDSHARGKLLLLSAGWRSGTRFAEYAEAVHAFDWAGFYSRFRGHEYFDSFRRELLSLADVVLVDSRTGITEMSGVCTRHLADVVVSLCAPNSQNLGGVIEMTDSFRSDAVAKARGRQIEVLILPARIDDQDSAGYSVFRSDFLRQTERYTPAILQEWKRSAWDLAIPYKAQYSYGERLATGVAGSNEQVERIYVQLATQLALFAPWGSKLWKACLPELKSLPPPRARIFRRHRHGERRRR
jgi:CobQ/CobB/MinD/ParA nucleotide binding domain